MHWLSRANNEGIMQAQIIGNLILALVAVVTVEIGTCHNQGFPLHAQVHPEPVYQHTTACIHYINKCRSTFFYRSLFYRSVVLSVVLGPAVSMLAGNLLEMQFLASTQIYKIRNSSVGA